jgi:hypothetical protein
VKEQYATEKRAAISPEKPATAENLLDIPAEGKKRARPFSAWHWMKDGCPMFGE